MEGGESFFNFTKWLMLVAGTWELELVGVSNAWKNIYKIYKVMIFIMFHSFHMSLLIRLVEVAGVDTDRAVQCLSMIIVVFLMGIKMIICRGKRMCRVLKDAIENVNAFSKDDTIIKNIFLADSSYALTMNIALTVWSFFVGSFLAVSGVFETLEFRRTHDITNENIETPLQVPCWYPFDVRKHYILVLAYQFFTIEFSCIYNSALIAFTNTIIMQIVTHLKVLQHRFRHFTKDNVTGGDATEKQAYQNLRECIIRHQRLIEHNEELNNVLKYAFLIEYAVSSLMLAAILVQIIAGKKPFYNTIYFGLLAFQWFVLSWNANEILVQSEQLSMAIYESNWYKYSRTTNSLILILVLRTKKPLFLNIGPFGPLTNDATISRLKLAYTYTSLMST